jgi:hypothetical protein
MLRFHSRIRELMDHNSLRCCHPDRSRSDAGSDREWRDPDTFSCFMPHQGVLTTTVVQLFNEFLLSHLKPYLNWRIRLHWFAI